MRAPILALLMCTVSSAHADCLSYSGAVTVEGILSKETFAEQPNYESIAKGDAAATYYFVSPASPFCVAEGSNPDGLEPAEAKVTRVQLVFGEDAASSYATLRSHLGREVSCAGSFYRAMSGHHRSPVLLLHAKCAAGAQDTRSDASAHARPAG